MARSAITQTRYEARTNEGVFRAEKEKVRLAAHRADGVLALSAHIMEEVVDLDRFRQHLAADNLSLHTLLGEIQQTAIQLVTRIQRGYGDGWTS